MRLNREDPLAMMEQVKAVYRPGLPIRRFCTRFLAIVVVFFLSRVFRRHELIGIENLRKMKEYKRQGKKMVFDFDHFGWSDIPVPLALFWSSGFRELTNDVFYIIGFRFAEHFWVKGGDRVYIIPESIIPRELPTSERTKFKFYNGRSIVIAKKQLADGKAIWMSSQGTRSRINPARPLEPPGQLANVQDAHLVWKNADFVIPIAIEGTERLSPVGTWRPRLWSRVKVMVGEPIPVDHGHPTANEMGVARAKLHIQFGDPRYAGVYREEAESLVRCRQAVHEEVAARQY